MAQRVERHALEQQINVVEDVEAVGRLKTGLIELMLHAQAIKAWEGDVSQALMAASFGDDFGHLVADYEQFKRDW